MENIFHCVNSLKDNADGVPFNASSLILMYLYDNNESNIKDISRFLGDEKLFSNTKINTLLRFLETNGKVERKNISDIDNVICNLSNGTRSEIDSAIGSGYYPFDYLTKTYLDDAASIGANSGVKKENYDRDFLVQYLQNLIQLESTLVTLDMRYKYLAGIRNLLLIEGLGDASNNAAGVEDASYKKRVIVETEMRIIIKMAQETFQIRQDYYGMGIIFPKYRHFAAVTNFYDYLSSWRCESLEGASGAYNLYEQEMRQNLILEKLDEIVNSLEIIKRNQYSLYSEVVKMNTELEKVHGQLLITNETMNKGIEKIDAVIENLETLNGVAEEIKCNSEIAAFYSKKNAELTDSLGFLMAMK